MKNFVIIGASSGMGKAIAAQLIQDGHQVYSFSRSAQIELDVLRHVQVDITKEDFPADQLPEEIHGIAYCPGSINLKSFRSLSPQVFRDEFEVNLIGAVKTLKASMKGLSAAGEAYVLLFSTVAVGTGMPFHASVAAAKGAVEGLVRSLAAELAPNVRVNALAPSLVDTPLAKRLLSSDDKRKMSEERHPLKMVGDPEKIAKFAKTLLDGTADWMTGQVVSMDGGMSAIRK